MSCRRQSVLMKIWNFTLKILNMGEALASQNFPASKLDSELRNKLLRGMSEFTTDGYKSFNEYLLCAGLRCAGS